MNPNKNMENEMKLTKAMIEFRIVRRLKNTHKYGKVIHHNFAAVNGYS
jgi:hypothetical protein